MKEDASIAVVFPALFALGVGSYGKILMTVHNLEALVLASLLLVLPRPGQAATPVEQLIDTTGAGDAYCAGFLYGWVHDKSLAECARADLTVHLFDDIEHAQRFFVGVTE